MDFWRVIEARHSVRDFRPDAVPHDALERVIRAAALAPSSFNSQPWLYHVTTGEARQKVGEILAQGTVHLSEYMDVLGPQHYEDAVAWYSSLGDAPVVIGVSMPDHSSGLELTNKLLAMGASIENLMLAATAEGLATCTITFAWWVREELSEFFGLDAERDIISIIALGYPSDVPPAAPPKNGDIADWLD